MKKIVMITKIKNEADIIESFLRYHIRIFNSILVIDNGSMDGSSDIVNALINEGLAIEYIDDSKSEFDDFKYSNKYTYDYIIKTDADYVILMDADEFLYETEGKDLRIELEKLDENCIHYVNWRTYLYRNRQDGMFNPKDYNFYRDDEQEKFTKVILPGKLVLTQKAVIAEGNHSAKIIGGNKTNYIHNIKFLHFPVRGRKQYIKQIVLNSLDMLSYPDKGIQTGSHWKKMYDIINDDIDLEKMSLKYAYYDGNNIKEESLKIHLETRYDYLVKDNLQSIFLQTCEIMALKLKAERINNEEAKDKRIRLLIYGTGDLSNRMVQRLNRSIYEIVAFIDSNKEKQFTTFNNKIVISPEKIKFFDFDIIAIGSDSYAQEMRETIRQNLPWLTEDRIKSIELLVIEGYR